MLFKADISGDALLDENKLCEQLYIFLGDYVYKRLTYESTSEKEDCIQDTIMHLLKRYKALTNEQKQNINIEKFFYNRANSHISFYLRKLKIERDAQNKYSSNLILLDSVESYLNEEYIDNLCLDKILLKYGLSNDRRNLLKKLSINKLIDLGYNNVVEVVSNEELTRFGPADILNALSYSVVDEYLVESIKEVR